METLDFTNLDETEFDDLLDEIQQNEDEINKLDEWIRSQWKIGSIVSIYLNNEWIKGNIIKISEDMLHIKNSQNGKIEEWKRNNVDFIRPFFGAMAVYKYIFNAIATSINDDVDIDMEYSDESDAETPQPLDTPQPILHNIDKIKLNYLDNMQHLTLSDHSDDDSLNGIGPTQIEQSRSLELRTCTKLKSSSSSIKCITPTTQSIAEHKIQKYFRRRSVATIDHNIHRLFQLDADLLKIREQYLERLDNESD